MSADARTISLQRVRLLIRGAVQGVGFRPHVHHLATELRLVGWVSNTNAGVALEVQGLEPRLREFLIRVESDKPPHARIHSLEPIWLDPAPFDSFEIRPSDPGGEAMALVVPDIATCADCLREIFDPSDRRYRYPFTNCTHCGPRYSIITELPYDRAGTSMREFTMCAECEREYHDPRDRRFHAQPNACPACGPHLSLLDATGQVLAGGEEALQRCAGAIRDGLIVAVKGLGGFHLMVDAEDGAAVQRLRDRKHRDEKPLAVMVPCLSIARDCCAVSDLEERLLCSPEAPIVLLSKSKHSAIASKVAPGNPYLGVMLPYTPLHHLLLDELRKPVVATSGNLSDEPICTEYPEALRRLHGVADAFLVHDRRIVRHVDDSVVRIMLDRESVLRRARGYAPLPVSLAGLSCAEPILGAGAHLKSTVALGVRSHVFVSQHIGDLENAESLAAFETVAADLQKLFQAPAQRIAADAHPDYLSTRYASAKGLPLCSVQHHYAHALACMAENELVPPVLAVTWDGTGHGLDGTAWGGEFLLVKERGFERVATLMPFPLPGGDAAAREPRRSALGILFALRGKAAFHNNDLAPLRAFADREINTIRRMLELPINAPLTSSAGRLFDAVASLLDLRQVSAHEGQAAMLVEFAAFGSSCDQEYPFGIHESSTPWIVDWHPTISAILADLDQHKSPAHIAAAFHNTLAAMITAVAARCGDQQVVLTGGCFQNRELTERTVRHLRGAGFKPYWHQRIPPNDGGIALGQVVAAIRDRVPLCVT